jgi:hypothetical protein
MRLDVAIVGFLVFTILGPFAGGYLGAWLIDGTGSRAIVAFLAGGSGTQALAGRGQSRGGANADRGGRWNARRRGLVDHDLTCRERIALKPPLRSPRGRSPTTRETRDADARWGAPRRRAARGIDPARVVR